MSGYEIPLLPRAESAWLAGERGPLAARGLPGTVTVNGHGVTLDQRALDSLLHLGRVSGHDDGRVVYDGDLPVLVFGNARFEIHER